MNIVLDFTANKSIASAMANQPVAVMPAELAKKLLMNYASLLASVSSYEVIKAFRMSIDVNGTVAESIQRSLEYIQERQLIANIDAGNWGAYEVDEVEATMDRIMEDIVKG